MVRPLFARRNKHIVFQPGITLLAKKDEFQRSSSSTSVVSRFAAFASTCLRDRMVRALLQLDVPWQFGTPTFALASFEPRKHFVCVLGIATVTAPCVDGPCMSAGCSVTGHASHR